MGRLNGRVDNNQADIVQAFRAAGACVDITSNVGRGFPDLIVGVGCMVYLVEVKNEKTWYGKRGYNPTQQKFFDNWRGQMCIIKTIEEALNLVKDSKALQEAMRKAGIESPLATMSR